MNMNLDSAIIHVLGQLMYPYLLQKNISKKIYERENVTTVLS